MTITLKMDILAFIEGFAENSTPTADGLQKWESYLKTIIQDKGRTFTEIDIMNFIAKYIEYFINFVYNLANPREQITASKHFFRNLQELIKQNYVVIFFKTLSRYILDIIIEDDIKYWIKKELLHIYYKCAKTVNVKTRRIVACNLPDTYLFKMVDIISSLGDYDFQVLIIETVFCLYGMVAINRKLNDLIPESQELSQRFIGISGESFSDDVRSFLQILNRSSGRIFSVLCTTVKLGDTICYQTKGDLDNIWVNFNVTDKVMSWNCSKNCFSEQLSEDEDDITEFLSITIFMLDIGNVVVYRSADQSSLLLIIGLNKPCISSSEGCQQFVDKAKELTIVLTESDESSKLVSDILPGLLGDNIIRENVKSNNSSKKISKVTHTYKPLKISTLKCDAKSYYSTPSCRLFNPLSITSSSKVESYISLHDTTAITNEPCNLRDDTKEERILKFENPSASDSSSKKSEDLFETASASSQHLSFYSGSSGRSSNKCHRKTSRVKPIKIYRRVSKPLQDLGNKMEDILEETECISKGLSKQNRSSSEDKEASQMYETAVESHSQESTLQKTQRDLLSLEVNIFEDILPTPESSRTTKGNNTSDIQRKISSVLKYENLDQDSDGSQNSLLSSKPIDSDDEGHQKGSKTLSTKIQNKANENEKILMIPENLLPTPESSKTLRGNNNTYKQNKVSTSLKLKNLNQNSEGSQNSLPYSKRIDGGDKTIDGHQKRRKSVSTKKQNEVVENEKSLKITESDNTTQSSVANKIPNRGYSEKQKSHWMSKEKHIVDNTVKEKVMDLPSFKPIDSHDEAIDGHQEIGKALSTKQQKEVVKNEKSLKIPEADNTTTQSSVANKISHRGCSEKQKSHWMSKEKHIVDDTVKEKVMDLPSFNLIDSDDEAIHGHQERIKTLSTKRQNEIVKNNKSSKIPADDNTTQSSVATERPSKGSSEKQKSPWMSKEKHIVDNMFQKKDVDVPSSKPIDTDDEAIDGYQERSKSLSTNRQNEVNENEKIVKISEADKTTQSAIANKILTRGFSGKQKSHWMSKKKHIVDNIFQTEVVDLLSSKHIDSDDEAIDGQQKRSKSLSTKRQNEVVENEKSLKIPEADNTTQSAIANKITSRGCSGKQKPHWMSKEKHIVDNIFQTEVVDLLSSKPIDYSDDEVIDGQQKRSKSLSTKRQNEVVENEKSLQIPEADNTTQSAIANKITSRGCSGKQKPHWMSKEKHIVDNIFQKKDVDLPSSKPIDSDDEAIDGYQERSKSLSTKRQNEVNENEKIVKIPEADNTTQSAIANKIPSRGFSGKQKSHWMSKEKHIVDNIFQTEVVDLLSSKPIDSDDEAINGQQKRSKSLSSKRQNEVVENNKSLKIPADDNTTQSSVANKIPSKGSSEKQKSHWISKEKHIVDNIFQTEVVDLLSSKPIDSDDEAINGQQKRSKSLSTKRQNEVVENEKSLKIPDADNMTQSAIANKISNRGCSEKQKSHWMSKEKHIVDNIFQTEVVDLLSSKPIDSDDEAIDGQQKRSKSLSTKRQNEVVENEKSSKIPEADNTTQSAIANKITSRGCSGKQKPHWMSKEKHIVDNIFQKKVVDLLSSKHIDSDDEAINGQQKRSKSLSTKRQNEVVENEKSLKIPEADNTTQSAIANKITSRGCSGKQKPHWMSKEKHIVDIFKKKVVDLPSSKPIDSDDEAFDGHPKRSKSLSTNRQNEIVENEKILKIPAEADNTTQGSVANKTPNRDCSGKQKSHWMSKEKHIPDNIIEKEVMDPINRKIVKEPGQNRLNLYQDITESKNAENASMAVHIDKKTKTKSEERSVGGTLDTHNNGETDSSNKSDIYNLGQIARKYSKIKVISHYIIKEMTENVCQRNSNEAYSTLKSLSNELSKTQENNNIYPNANLEKGCLEKKEKGKKSSESTSEIAPEINNKESSEYFGTAIDCTSSMGMRQETFQSSKIPHDNVNYPCKHNDSSVKTKNMKENLVGCKISGVLQKSCVSTRLTKNIKSRYGTLIDIENVYNNADLDIPTRKKGRKGKKIRQNKKVPNEDLKSDLELLKENIETSSQNKSTERVDSQKCDIDRRFGEGSPDKNQIEPNKDIKSRKIIEIDNSGIRQYSTNVDEDPEKAAISNKSQKMSRFRKKPRPRQIQRIVTSPNSNVQVDITKSQDAIDVDTNEEKCQGEILSEIQEKNNDNEQNDEYCPDLNLEPNKGKSAGTGTIQGISETSRASEIMTWNSVDDLITRAEEKSHSYDSNLNKINNIQVEENLATSQCFDNIEVPEKSTIQEYNELKDTSLDNIEYLKTCDQTINKPDMVKDAGTSILLEDPKLDNAKLEIEESTGLKNNTKSNSPSLESSSKASSSIANEKLNKEDHIIPEKAIRNLKIILTKTPHMENLVRLKLNQCTLSSSFDGIIETDISTVQQIHTLGADNLKIQNKNSQHSTDDVLNADVHILNREDKIEDSISQLEDILQPSKIADVLDELVRESGIQKEYQKKIDYLEDEQIFHTQDLHSTVDHRIQNVFNLGNLDVSEIQKQSIVDNKIDLRNDKGTVDIQEEQSQSISASLKINREKACATDHRSESDNPIEEFHKDKSTHINSSEIQSPKGNVDDEVIVSNEQDQCLHEEINIDISRKCVTFATKSTNPTDQNSKQAIFNDISSVTSNQTFSTNTSGKRKRRRLYVPDDYAHMMETTFYETILPEERKKSTYPKDQHSKQAVFDDLSSIMSNKTFSTNTSANKKQKRLYDTNDLSRIMANAANETSQPVMNEIIQTRNPVQRDTIYHQLSIIESANKRKAENVSNTFVTNEPKENRQYVRKRRSIKEGSLSRKLKRVNSKLYTADELPRMKRDRVHKNITKRTKNPRHNPALRHAFEEYLKSGQEIMATTNQQCKRQVRKKKPAENNLLHTILKEDISVCEPRSVHLKRLQKIKILSNSLLQPNTFIKRTRVESNLVSDDVISNVNSKATHTRGRTKDNVNCSVARRGPNWRCKAFSDNEFITAKSSDYHGKYLVLYFFPFYRSYPKIQLPKDLVEMNGRIGEFLEINTSVVACPFGSSHMHEWIKRMKQPLKMPILLDSEYVLSGAYNVYLKDMCRSVFVIDPKGIMLWNCTSAESWVTSADMILKAIKCFQSNSVG